MRLQVTRAGNPIEILVRYVGVRRGRHDSGKGRRCCQGPGGCSKKGSECFIVRSWDRYNSRSDFTNSRNLFSNIIK